MSNIKHLFFIINDSDFALLDEFNNSLNDRYVSMLGCYVFVANDDGSSNTQPKYYQLHSCFNEECINGFERYVYIANTPLYHKRKYQ